MTVDWIRQGLKDTRKTRSGLAKALGRSPSAVTDLLNGSRRLRAEEIAIVAEYLGIEPPRLIGGGRPAHPIGRVPLVGYVGAGAIAHFYADGQGPFDDVEAPDTASPKTVAVQIRGHSLGALFDNWLVFYDDVHEFPEDERLVGRMCVCGLSDGRVLVKALKRSQIPGIGPSCRTPSRRSTTWRSTGRRWCARCGRAEPWSRRRKPVSQIGSPWPHRPPPRSKSRAR